MLSTIVKVNGLGFEMEFDLVDFINDSRGIFVSKTSYNDTKIFKIKNVKDTKTNTELTEFNNVLMSVNEFNILKSNKDYRILFDTVSDSITEVKSNTCFTQLMLLFSVLDAQDNNLLSRKYIMLKRDRISDSLILKSFLDNIEDVYSLETLAIYKLREALILSGLKTEQISDAKDLRRFANKILSSLNLMRCVYVSKYLNIDIVDMFTKTIACVKMPGTFSSTYKVYTNVNGLEFVSNVTVKSNGCAEVK